MNFAPFARLTFAASIALVLGAIVGVAVDNLRRRFR